MSAVPLQFPEWLHLPVEQGLLTPRQAWVLEWELLVLFDQPWTPEAWEVKQAVALFHWEPDSLAH